MKCLYCGKDITSNNEIELNNKWHNKCVKEFFYTSTFPALSLNEEEFNKIINDNVNLGLTIPGVQKKLSLGFVNQDRKKLTIMNYPTGYILKPQSNDYKYLPELEYLTMLMAKSIGIRVVPFGLIKQNDKYFYITKRIDRDIKGNNITLIAMEDFCQLDGRLTEDKYHSSYERVGKIICQYSYLKEFDLSELFTRLVFCFVIGNSDMHLKNFSLIKSENGYVLSPAYDLLPVNIILTSDNEEVALSLNDKKRNITKKDFIGLGKNIGLIDSQILKIIKYVVSNENNLLSFCINNNLIDDHTKEAWIKLIKERINRIR